MIKSPDYFYGIDFLRWFAAFGVVLYHYSLYFNVVDIDYNFFLNYLVKNREYAPQFVWLFWGISGFVLANIYLNKVISIKKFLISRFARLYPLHFITLIIVFFLQFYSLQNFGQTQLNKNNDIYHFILHFFFASDWGMQKEWSYNAPVWSVSVEIPIYFLFIFCLYYLRKFKIYFCIIISVFFYYIFPEIFNLFKNLGNFELNKWQKLSIFNFRTCIFYFFLGSGIFLFYLKLKNFRKLFFYLSFISICVCVTFMNINTDIHIINIFPSNFMLIISLILFFACFDYVFPNLAFRVHFLSNTSYSIYLIHFPLQLIILVLFKSLGVSLDILDNFIYFLLFIVLLQIISSYSFKFFESPMRKYINSLYK